MHTKVVYHAMKSFTSFGIPTLRFNFRGTGLSQGIHDEGRGEVQDVKAALAWLECTFSKPILLAGFSFGSNVAMRAGCGDPRVAGLVGLGLPVRAAGRDYTYNFLPGCTQPKLFISGDSDQFCPQDILDGILSTAAQPWQRIMIPGAEHFFQGTPGSPKPKLDDMRAVLNDWLIHTFHLAKA